jgi:hypothetical protein
MARIKRTSDYLTELQNKGYPRCDEFRRLYAAWVTDFEVKSLLNFLNLSSEEKDSIKPKYLGENTYNNFRGIAFEEFCFNLLSKVLKDISLDGTVELFWNEKILTEEFYLFENGQFKKHPKFKAVDLVLGQSEDMLIHPFIILSCKVWQSTNWLDEDKAILDNIRSRYPYVLGYSLCMNLSAPPVSLISAQRNGLKVFDFSRQGKLEELITDIKQVLMEIRKNAS